MTLKLEQETVATALEAAASDWIDPTFRIRLDAITRTLEAPNTFTHAGIDFAIGASMRRITKEALLDWRGQSVPSRAGAVAVVNAGNVPFVGLFDFLAVVMSGRAYRGVVSRKSPFLLPAFAETVRNHLPNLRASFFNFADAVSEAEAAVVTGSSATTQLLSTQISKQGITQDAQLLRGTKSGAAVLTGDETDEDLYRLSFDVLLHEGRGCRSVSTILAPAAMDIDRFVNQANRFRERFPKHSTTVTALARTARLLHAVMEPAFAGDGFMVVESDVALREPCVIRWMRYNEPSEAENWIQRNKRSLQVVVRAGANAETGFGRSHDPSIDWCPDGLDTMGFLLSDLSAKL